MNDASAAGHYWVTINEGRAEVAYWDAESRSWRILGCGEIFTPGENELRVIAGPLPPPERWWEGSRPAASASPR